jgi:hypothetical protein
LRLRGDLFEEDGEEVSDFGEEFLETRVGALFVDVIESHLLELRQKKV